MLLTTQGLYTFLVLTCLATGVSSQTAITEKDVGISNITTKPRNKCSDESIYGGCNDFWCQNRVCFILDGCCDMEWDYDCVRAANTLCQPAIEPLPTIDGDCPNGMFCSDDQMVNCTDLASQYKEVFLVGDILGGIYCGNDVLPERRGITNCPRGSYCPNPETILPCPSGYYCPFKTKEPTMICKHCKEGSLEIVKDRYGWVVLSLIVAFVTVYIGLSVLRRYNERLANHISELEKRVSSVVKRRDFPITYFTRSSDLEKLRPKLEMIRLRLAKMEKVDLSSGSSEILLIENDRIELDSKNLFDVLDTDNSNDLSFDQLNAILGLSEVELREFARRMNEMSGSSSTRVTVTRHVFVNYFLKALTEVVNINISFEEAEAIYDELVDGIKTMNDVDINTFYASSMSQFMSEIQILELIKKFKRLKEDLELEAANAAPKRRMSTHKLDRRASSHKIQAQRRVSFQEFGDSRRGSIMSSGRPEFMKHQKSILNQMTSRRTLIRIERDTFIQNYPQLLMDVMINEGQEIDDEGTKLGVDLAFKDLSLSINLGKKSITVVNKVTGRLRGKTMTALMGGSGAGKTSLLNALCGRAHYGETTGTIYLNGHEIDIQEHVDCIGVVPQDDIVYAELTVRENFMYAGMFKLPNGTPIEEVEALADETIASLGLSRVANSPVGDATKRGLSGGEKKRVNIGIELMSMPSILFLDEPTSGLDASSAVVVMQSLNHLVAKGGVTIVSVIHQPRKFIFDLFDSLILLGVGGNLMYHGPTEGAEPYFRKLNFTLPKGESVSDWVLDVSSGRLQPNSTDTLKRAKTQNEGEGVTVDLKGLPAIPMADDKVTDDRCFGEKGVTTGKLLRAAEDAKERRVFLGNSWIEYFKNLDDEKKSFFEPPEEYALPVNTEKLSFWIQFIHQLDRAILVAWRNIFSKIVNGTTIVGAMIIISAVDGVTKVSIDEDPKIPFATLVRPKPSDLNDYFLDPFAYAMVNQIAYPMKIGLIVSCCIGLTATTTLTSKRLEFLREARSGYNMNAYFFAINTIATVEYSIQALLGAVFSTWLRNSIASQVSYYVHFLLLVWLTVGWSMLIPMVCPPERVILVAAVFFVTFGLVLSGTIPPLNYKMIYSGGVPEYITGWLSPTRFFFEALAVGEYRCLPEQSGMTITKDSIARLSESSMIRAMGYAGHDKNAIYWSCNGWYWSVLPAVFVGLTLRYVAVGAMHACFRAQQAKRPLIYVMKRNRSIAVGVVIYCLGFVVLFSVTSWLFVRDQPHVENRISDEELKKAWGSVSDVELDWK